MKKVTLTVVAAALLAAVPLHAQFRLGVKAGLNISTVRFNSEILRSDNIAGFHAGPVLEFMIGKSGFGIDAALLYSQKGFASERATVRTSYLEVPVNLKLKYGIPLARFFVAAGPYVGFRVSDGSLRDVSDSVQEQLKANSFGAGLSFAVGAELLGCLEVSLLDHWGLTDNYQTFDAGVPGSYQGKLHSWGLSATLFF